MSEKSETVHLACPNILFSLAKRYIYHSPPLRPRVPLSHRPIKQVAKRKVKENMITIYIIYSKKPSPLYPCLCDYLNGTVGRWDGVAFGFLLIMCKIPCKFAAVSDFLCNFAF